MAHTHIVMYNRNTDYRITRETDALLGKGTSGSVYLAELSKGKAASPKAQRKNIALKLINKNTTEGSKAYAKYVLHCIPSDSLCSEISALKKIAHENIVKLLDYGQDENTAYLALEYVPYPSLEELLGTEGPFSEMQCKSIIKQVILALRSVHALGIVHHDIKPANILLMRNGTVKLIDWGLSFTHDKSKGLSKIFSGTPLCSPTEVLEGEPYDPFSAEMWTVGVLSYMLIVGGYPFEAEELPELITLQKKGEIIYFDDIVDPSDAFKDFVERLLEQKPEDRLTLEEALAHPFLANI